MICAVLSGLTIGLIGIGLYAWLQWWWDKDVAEYDHEYDGYGD